MSKWQSKELPIPLTMLALLLSSTSDKIEEWTSIPENAVLITSCVILIIPLFIWISGWLKSRK
jgi:hypothetical protein